MSSLPIKGILASVTDAVCLISGGTDSATAAFLVCDHSPCRIWPVYIQRGAAAERHELQAAHEIVSWLIERFDHRVHRLKAISCEYPPKSLKALIPESLKAQYGYPGRELVLVSVAIMYAWSIGGNEDSRLAVVCGSLGEDLFAHNSAAFWEAYVRLSVIELGNGFVPVINPLQVSDFGGPYNKRSVISLARSVGLPVDLCRSCVSATERACGVCLECVQRIAAEANT